MTQLPRQRTCSVASFSREEAKNIQKCSKNPRIFSFGGGPTTWDDLQPFFLVLDHWLVVGLDHFFFHIYIWG